MVAAIVDEPHAMHVLFLLGVHGGGQKKFEEHASMYKRRIKNTSDDHRSIGPCPVVAAIVDEPHAMRVLFLLGVHGSALKKFEEHASKYIFQK